MKKKKKKKKKKKRKKKKKKKEKEGKLPQCKGRLGNVAQFVNVHW